jgi:NAD+ synthase (glutamine-hydrolysing)
MITVASCNLNQWALDFDDNLERVKESIRIAKSKGALYRLGPELELCGYGCEDHFLESDTLHHCDESLADLLSCDLSDGILCDIGLPLLHKGVRYNCRVFILDRKVIFVRPKLAMADDGNYRETRYFTPWPRDKDLEEIQLPSLTAAACGQKTCPFGFAIIDCFGTSFGTETCEELWAPNSPHIQLALNGCEIIGNGSGSHHELRKLNTRVNLVKGASTKSGGVYLYANQCGCDGSRLYYDGCSLIMKNGQILSQAKQFDVADVEVIVATVDLDDVRSYRASISSMQLQGANVTTLPRINVDATFKPIEFALTTPIQPARYHSPQEECAFGPACWLWDYLRRSGASGYFLPLSGGADSGATACIVGVMCELVAAEVRNGNKAVESDALRVCGEGVDPTDPKALASSILHCCYMGTAHSSMETRSRAQNLSNQIGCYFSNMEVDMITDAIITVFSKFISGGKTPQFLSKGGNMAQDLALQNIQARCRMVMSYLCAQLLPWVRNKTGFLLVLGSANVDEALRGYMTKYDCSSADLNPIGAISKLDLKELLKWASDAYGYSALRDIEEAAPTAELRPDTEEGKAQTDEDDMGMSYEDLGYYGRLRKIDRCGPLSMFKKLVNIWRNKYSPSQVATKVKFFFKMYSINRHKMTTVTPAYHAESYSPCDNRFDHRQFLYNASWTRQNKSIDLMVAILESQPKTY